MKQNMVFNDSWNEEALSAVSLANLQKIQQGLLVGLGAIAAYVFIAVGIPEPFFENLVPVFLWLFLLMAPAAAGLVVYKFPAWQVILLAVRGPVILRSFSLSVHTLSTTVLFNFQWHPYEAGHWMVSALISLLYGAGILWLSFRLHRRVEEERGELFP
ncbi:MAG: hypothetical protein IPM53_19580 [Anaerolineaceae bacterium]|nr:hypothetical protein [Anaerolineaceae bacterium]